MSLYKQYLKEITRGLGYLATWMPNTLVSVGDVGEIQDGQFIRRGSLSDFDISYDVLEDDTESNLQYMSNGNVDVRFKLEGEAPLTDSMLTTMSAGIEVRFSAANAVVFQAKECRARTIENQIDLKNQLLRLDGTDWQNTYIVVNQVVIANSATFLVSNGSDSAFDITGQSAFGGDMLALADAKANFQVAQSKNLGLNIFAKKQLTPLFRACRLSKPIIGKQSWKQIRRSDKEMPPKVVAVDLEDLLPPDAVT